MHHRIQLHRHQLGNLLGQPLMTAQDPQGTQGVAFSRKTQKKQSAPRPTTNAAPTTCESSLKLLRNTYRLLKSILKNTLRIRYKITLSYLTCFSGLKGSSSGLRPHPRPGAQASRVPSQGYARCIGRPHRHRHRQGLRRATRPSYLKALTSFRKHCQRHCLLEPFDLLFASKSLVISWKMGRKT